MHATNNDVWSPPSLRPVLLPLSGLLLAQFVSGLSATIVATSIPTIIRTLDGPQSHATWIVAATILANTATIPIWGRLVDFLSPKRMLLIAIATYVVGTAAAGFSLNTTQLLISRAIQGIGLGGISAVALAIVALLVRPRERGRANSLTTSVQTAAMLLGPVLGGTVVQLLGWRWCFFLVVPLALLSMVVIGASLRVVRPIVVSRNRVDFVGAALIASGIPSALVAVTQLAQDRWTWTPVATGFAIYAVLAIVALVIVELRVEAPVIPIRILSVRTTMLCVIAAFFIGSTLFGGSVFITQYLQLGLGIPPSIAGLLIAPMALGTVTSSFISGRRISRTGRIKPVLLTGASIALLGNLLLAMAAMAPLALALSGAFLIATGLGAVTQNLVLTAQSVTAQGRVGSVGSTVMFFFTLGGSFGLVALGAIFALRHNDLRSAGFSEPDAYVVGMPSIFIFSSCAVVIGVVAISLVRDVTVPFAQPILPPVTV